jgi:hypothetical protein
MSITPVSLGWYRRLGRLLIACFLALHIFFLWSIRGRISRGDPDFTIFITAAKMLRRGLGGQLYQAGAQYQVQREFTTDFDIRRGPLPYNHPPFEALVFLPLTFLPYTAAFVLWNLINLAMLFWVCLLLRRSLASLRKIPIADSLLACLAFFPIVANFHQGQDAILLLLILVLGFRALDRGADFSAGCWLAADLFKFHLLLPIVLVLVFWRGKKLLAGFALAASGLVAVSLALIGWQEAWQYPEFALRTVTTVRMGAVPPGLSPNLKGILNGWPLPSSLGWLLHILAIAASAGLLVMLAFMKGLAHQARLFHPCLACVVIAAVLISYNTNSYDLSSLVLSIALLLDYCLRSAAPSRKLRALFLPALPLFISPLWFILWLAWARTNVMAIFLLWWCYAIWNEVHGASSSRSDEKASSLHTSGALPSSGKRQAVT